MKNYIEINISNINFGVFCIYMFVNNKTGQKYIGKTNNIFIRIDSHIFKAFKKNISYCFYKNLRDFGIDNFSLYILENNIKKADVENREEFWIKEEKTFIDDNPLVGLNMTTGGSFCKRSVLSNFSGENNPFFGKFQKEESKQKRIKTMQIKKENKKRGINE
jgi:group I intron endonuclease